jgi:hypothetical protein
MTPRLLFPNWTNLLPPWLAPTQQDTQSLGIYRCPLVPDRLTDKTLPFCFPYHPLLPDPLMAIYGAADVVRL